MVFIKSMVANDEPASWKLVIPFERTSRSASSRTLRARARRSSGEPGVWWINPSAVSRSRPVGSPFASFSTSPPAGFTVARVIPDSSIALPLTKLAWPLACVSTTGLSGETRSRDACVGKPSTFGVGADVHFSWCQPRPTIHCPGFAVLTASSTIATIASHDVTFIRFRLSCASPTPVKWPCPSMKPGVTSRPCASITCVDGPT